MSKFFLMQMVLLGSVFLSSSGTVAQAEGKAILLQLESSVLGASRVLINKNGMRLELDQTHVVVAMKAPAWKVQCWKPRTKLYYECTPSEWKPRLAVFTALFRPTDASSLHVVLSKPDTLNGVSARKYELVSPDADKNGPESWRGLLVRNGAYWVIDDKEIPESVTTVIQRTYGIPIVAGIPLALKTRTNKGSSREELRFISKSFKDATSADFEVPSGFRRVKQQEDVTNDLDVNHGFSEFIR
jgi:hypothetical protein